MIYNNVKPWTEEIRRVFVNEIYSYNGQNYQNRTGRNVQPSEVSVDWLPLGGSGAGGAVFTEDILVKLGPGESFGKYVNNDVIPATGKNSNEVIKMSVSKQIPPTYTAPSTGINGTSNIDIESGTTQEITVNGTFTQNDGGAKTTEKIFKNNIEVETDNSYTESIKLSSTVTYRYEASYLQGPIKNDNNGDPYPTGRIQAGTAVSINRTYTPVLKRFFGPAAAGLVNHRTLPSVFDNTSNTWILNTGTVFKDYYIDIPNGRSLVSVIDLDALNLNITNLFNLNSGNIPDAGGDNQAYKKLLMTSDNPYPANHRFQITIS